jgi:hypothetical protein
MATKMNRRKQICPRLYKGIREGNFHRLPYEIKRSLMNIARDENKSMSWVLEQVIIDYFQLDVPRYKKIED